MEAFFLGSLIHAAEIISKVWIRISCEQDLHHAVTNESKKKAEVERE